MARAWRIEFDGALYHVLSRGNNHQDIFLTDADRRVFLAVLGKMAARFDVGVLAYVLMDNHYHLLLRTERANLSKSMHWLGTTYTTRFNLSHARGGHLFQGRYKSILVEDDAYLMRLSCYIHRNPLRAGSVERLIEYRWSSYPAYAYKRRHPQWLKTEPILSLFEGKNRHRLYRETVQKYSEEERSIWEDIKHGIFLGTQDFIDRMKDTYLSDEPCTEIPGQKRVVGDINSGDLLESAAKILKCDLEKLKQARRVTDVNKMNRDMLIYLLWETGVFGHSDIGVRFGLTYSSVSRRVKEFQRQLDVDDGVRESYEKLKSQIKV
jgi:REP element-mobilizing transposase RayT